LYPKAFVFVKFSSRRGGGKLGPHFTGLGGNTAPSCVRPWNLKKGNVSIY